MTALYHIDLQHNISLSSNSSAFKYMLVYTSNPNTLNYTVNTLTYRIKSEICEFSPVLMTINEFMQSIVLTNFG